MYTTFTTYFDGQFWVGLLEREEEGTTRAVKVTFGDKPSDAELYEWVTSQGSSLVERLDAAVAVPADTNRRVKRPNPKRALREASRAARAPRASTAAQAALKAEQEAQGQAAALERKRVKAESAEQKRVKKRLRAKAKHRGR